MANISSNGRVTRVQGVIHHRKTLKKYGLHLSKYRSHRVDRLYKDYTKFVVVRHPLDRLLSAYYDKIASPNPKFRKTSRIIAETYGSTNVHYPNRFASFEQFCQMITAENRLSRNIHWDSYFGRCNFCHIRYDYIIKLETMLVDLPYFLSQVYNNSDISLYQSVNVNSRREETGMTYEKILHEYQNISAALVEKLLNKFKFELTALGYDYNLKNFTMQSVSNREREKCL